MAEVPGQVGIHEARWAEVHAAFDELIDLEPAEQVSRLAGALDCPNVCKFYNAGEASVGRRFLAMPLYAAETLKARLARDGALPVDAHAATARPVARSLAAAHRGRLVHRELDQTDAMLLSDGAATILDLRLVKVRDLSRTGADARMGTLACMSPQQFPDGPVGARTATSGFP